METLRDLRQHLVHGDRVGGTAGVEHADGPLFGHANGPFGQVAGIDELHRVAPIARRQDLATARQPHGPVGEAVGLVARPHDQARADDRGGGLAVLGARLLFTHRLQRAVEPLVGVQRLDRLSHGVVAPVGHERSSFVGRRVVGGIDRDGRDEDVLADVAFQHAGGVVHPDRQRGRIIDADVPVAALERFEVAVAIAEQFLDRAGPGLLLTAAVEDGDEVPAGQRIADLVRSNETRAAEDQQAHRL